LYTLKKSCSAFAWRAAGVSRERVGYGQAEQAERQLVFGSTARMSRQIDSNLHFRSLMNCKSAAIFEMASNVYGLSNGFSLNS